MKRVFLSIVMVVAIAAFTCNGYALTGSLTSGSDEYSEADHQQAREVERKFAAVRAISDLSAPRPAIQPPMEILEENGQVELYNSTLATVSLLATENCQMNGSDLVVPSGYQCTLTTMSLFGGSPCPTTALNNITVAANAALYVRGCNLTVNGDITTTGGIISLVGTGSMNPSGGTNLYYTTINMVQGDINISGTSSSMPGELHTGVTNIYFQWGDILPQKIYLGSYSKVLANNRIFSSGFSNFGIASTSQSTWYGIQSLPSATGAIYENFEYANFRNCEYCVHHEHQSGTYSGFDIDMNYVTFDNIVSGVRVAYASQCTAFAECDNDLSFNNISLDCDAGMNPYWYFTLADTSNISSISMDNIATSSNAQCAISYFYSAIEVGNSTNNGYSTTDFSLSNSEFTNVAGTILWGQRTGDIDVNNVAFVEASNNYYASPRIDLHNTKGNVTVDNSYFTASGTAIAVQSDFGTKYFSAWYDEIHQLSSPYSCTSPLIDLSGAWSFIEIEESELYGYCYEPADYEDSLINIESPSSYWFYFEHNTLRENVSYSPYDGRTGIWLETPYVYFITDNVFGYDSKISYLDRPLYQNWYIVP